MRKTVLLGKEDFAAHISTSALQELLTARFPEAEPALSIYRDPDGKISGGDVEVRDGANISGLKAAIRAHSVPEDQTDEEKSKRANVTLLDRFDAIEKRLDKLEGK